jgi:hypothetical protein
MRGEQLSPTQLEFLKNEKHPGASAEELLQEMDGFFKQAESVVRMLDPQTLGEPREIGRKRLPTTVNGLLVHTAEHIQRHVGQAISAAKLAQVGPRVGP